MKKTYTKPQIAFESFLTTTNIAANCEYVLGSPDLYVPPFGIMFMGDKEGCSYLPEPGGDGSYNGVCYDVPIDSSNLFSS